MVAIIGLLYFADDTADAEAGLGRGEFQWPGFNNLPYQ